jgi:hypothetical protein
METNLLYYRLGRRSCHQVSSTTAVLGLLELHRDHGTASLGIPPPLGNDYYPAAVVG